MIVLAEMIPHTVFGIRSGGWGMGDGVSVMNGDLQRFHHPIAVPD
ncbi:MAG: hypothetical protein AAGJ55_01310 [Cyanobacteria bacterium J06555_12]